jgi:hypothetical protein
MAEQDGGPRRLGKHLRRVAAQLAEKFEEATEKHTGTPDAVAEARESALRGVVQRFFPEPYKVSKGAIYDTHGGRSASIDCVVCSPNHPYLLGEDGRLEILLADAVHAAIELKPDLTDLPADYGAARKSPPELIRGLGQISSVKALRRSRSAYLVGSPSAERRDYAQRCPSYLVAKETSDIARLGQYIADYYVRRGVSPSLQVDVVLVLRQGLLLNNKAADFSLTKTTGVWRPHLAAYTGEEDFISLFFLRLVSEIGPELSMSEPVMKRYIEALFNDVGRPKFAAAWNTT